MMISRGFRTTLSRVPALALGIGLGLAPSAVLFAGSTQPNYPALKMQAEKVRTDLHGVDSQWTWLSGKFSDKAFASKFQAAAAKNDVAGLNAHLTASGFRFAPLQSAQKICSGKVCLALPAADDWALRKSQHAALLAKLDAFLLKLSQDKVFGEKFEALVMRKNQQGLLNFFGEAGYSPADIHILAMESDARIHIKWGWFEIDISW